MPDTPNLTLPYLAASQAQKHVTHNEALSLLDGLIHLAVVSRGLSSPPVSPTNGDRYLVATAPTGAWSLHGGQIALQMEGTWAFLVPREGWRLWVNDEDLLLTFNGTSWVTVGTPSALQNLTLLGVNATADVSNKLAVSSPSVLFNHAGAGVQFKVNKNSATDTAAILLQTGYSGRAEIGTAGDDNLHFKVSANGSAFFESLVIAANNGIVTVKNNIILDPQSADPAAPSNGQLWYNSTSAKFRTHQNGVSVDVIANQNQSAIYARHLISN